MLKKHRSIYSKTLLSNKELGYEIDEKELSDETLEINLYRERLFSALILLLLVILILVDLAYYYPLWKVNPALKSLFYSHVVVLMLFPVISYIINPYFKPAGNLSCNSKRLLLNFKISFMLYWSVFLALNAQFIHGQISAYTICAFSISAAIILELRESVFIFLPSYILFLCGMAFTKQRGVDISGNIINSAFLLTLAFCISRINYNYYVSNYIGRKTIELKTLELNRINSNLEKLVYERTNELVCANRQLISEMETRHKAEMEAAAARSVYEEKEREFDKAIEMERLRTAIFANISHEFRTPLNVVLSAEQLLEYKLKNMKDQEAYNQVSRHAGLIRQNCYRLIRLVSNLLDMNKIELGFLELNLKNYNIVQVIEDIVMSVASFIESKDIELVFDTFVEEKVIACDADKIERVLLNLLSNAVKFTPCNGLIVVRLSVEEGCVAIAVKDTGAGIPEDKIGSIFERYVQIDSSLTANRYGSGIGLSLVKSIIELHQGTISVHSIQGAGSEFIIRLPDRRLETDAVKEGSGCYTTGNKIDMINVEFSDIYL